MKEVYWISIRAMTPSKQPVSLAPQSRKKIKN